MFFHTNDIMNEKNALEDYEVVFLAALVGMDKEDKVKFVDHLAKLAHGSRSSFDAEKCAWGSRFSLSSA